MHFMVVRFDAIPDHLHVHLPDSPTAVTLHRLEAEADEMWSFVGKKANKQWLWLAMDTKTHQVIAFQVDDQRFNNTLTAARLPSRA